MSKNDKTLKLPYLFGFEVGISFKFYPVKWHLWNCLAERLTKPMA